MSVLLSLIFLFSFVIGIASTVLWVWMLVDCATKEPSEGNDKLIWVLVIVLAQGIGALIYLIVRRPERIARYGQ
ncbi:MAG: PLDc_N domain-containing protein [Pontiellaceae bacterium]|nr:PLDc_N domain-containing protein [Pontiellaceae bacterium]MBN2783822.1 PLDc_N domain-containing protein [Pontiellaceae bacterium]